MPPALTSLQFFNKLKWLDGRNLLDTVEPYRRAIFTKALDTYRADGVPAINFVLASRGKKNWKSADLGFAGLYCLLFRESHQGSKAFILANDADQAGDDLDLLKKVIACNDMLGDELAVFQREIRRRDERGSLEILPAKDVAGSHGKSANFIGFDEVHAYKTHDLFEAMAPDPTRADALTWVTSYDTIWTSPGVPLVDFKALGRSNADPRMAFSWYSGEDCSDPDFANLEPELRANPSMGSWPEGRGYLDQQRRRLPAHKFRRLHLNIGGAVNGAFFNQAVIEAAVVRGRTLLPPEPGRFYYAWVDMSGGSNDDATLGIAHGQDGKAILDLLISQDWPAPFDPYHAISQTFVPALRRYGVRTVYGDAYAGQTFRSAFSKLGVDYMICRGRVGSKISEADTREAPAVHRTDLYEALEPALNCNSVELLDLPKLKEQLLTLVVRGNAVDHEAGGHDDWANSAAGALYLVNPNRAGNNAENWLHYYKMLSEGRRVDGTIAPLMCDVDGIRPSSGPDHGWQFHQQNDWVVVTVPPGPLVNDGRMYVGGRMCPFTRRGDVTVVEILRSDLRELLSRPAWRACNLGLAAELGVKEAM